MYVNVTAPIYSSVIHIFAFLTASIYTGNVGDKDKMYERPENVIAIECNPAYVSSGFQEKTKTPQYLNM